MKKNCLLLILFILFNCFIFAETEGERLFRENKPEEAITALEKEINQNKVSKNTFNYLGLSYYQIGNFQKSIEAFENGIEKEIGDKKIMAFNLGNSYFGIKNYEKAVEFYSVAIEIDNNYSAPILNRSNCYVNLGRFEDAVGDYEKYLVLEPADKQKAKIEKLIELLKRKIKSDNEQKRQEKIQAESENSKTDEPDFEMISDEISDDINEMNRRDDHLKSSQESDLMEENGTNGISSNGYGSENDIILGDENIQTLDPSVQESDQIKENKSKEIGNIDDLIEEESLMMAVEEDPDLKEILLREEEERKRAVERLQEEAEKQKIEAEIREKAERAAKEEAEKERIRQEEDNKRIEAEKRIAELENARIKEAEESERKLAYEREMRKFREEMDAEKAQLEEELRAVRKAMREAQQEREDLEEEKRIAKEEAERQKSRLEEEKRIAKEEAERQINRLEEERRIAKEDAERQKNRLEEEKRLAKEENEREKKQLEEETKRIREQAAEEARLEKERLAEESRIEREKASEEERIRNEKAIEEQKIAIEAEKKQLEEELKAAKKAVKQAAKEKEELEEIAVAAKSKAKAAELEKETDFVFTSTNLYKKGTEAESTTKFEVSVPLEENLESWKLEIIAKSSGEKSEKIVRKYDGNTVEEMKSIVWDGTSQYGNLSLGSHKAKVQLDYDDGISISKISQNEISVFEDKPKVVKEVEVKMNADGTVDINIPTLSFKPNSKELMDTKANKDTVNKVFEIVTNKLYSKYSIVVIGYINPDGVEWTQEENILALGRAQEIVDRFTKMGIPKDRMKAEFGSGKTENKEFNRRVEFKLRID